MQKKEVKIMKTGFFGHFALGDNAQYNLKILNYLNSINDHQGFLNKLKIITLASIIESILADLFYRIENYTCEGVNNISDKNILEIRKILKKYNEKLNFYLFIDWSKRFELLGKNLKIYEELDDIRKLRNRIHNYNLSKLHPKEWKEENIFTKENHKKAENLFLLLVQKMDKLYDRGFNYVGSFHYLMDK